MLGIVSKWVTDQLIRRGIIADKRKAVYIYGCELILSTASSVLFILFAGLAAGRPGQALTFLLFFMPIRTVSSGYHAPSYGKCFILTNLTALVCVCGAELCLCCRQLADPFMWLLLTAAHLFIWLRGPFRSVSHPLKEEQIAGNRKAMHRIQILELAVCLCFGIAAVRVFLYTAILATAIVALMIAIAEKEEYKNVGSIGGIH